MFNAGFETIAIRNYDRTGGTQGIMLLLGCKVSSTVDKCRKNEAEKKQKIYEEMYSIRTEM